MDKALGKEIVQKPVVPHHEHTEKGVKFNVETVTEKADPEGYYYDGKELTRFLSTFYEEQFIKIKVEVSSLEREQIDFDARGFMQVAVYAFDCHYPLAIRPDDIWLVLSFSFAKHVDKNAEALRGNFVKHQGKQALVVDVPNFVPGQMKPEEWERDVFPEFSRQIQTHIGQEIHSAIASPFSTSTAVDKASHEITLMAAMKNYFSNHGRTCCGIPWIELQGSEQDWIDLRERAKKLTSLMVPAVGKIWYSFLEPVLEEFVAAYQGKVNHIFWQSMVKRIQHGMGSGSYSTISGWVTLLYHPLSSKHKSWQEMSSRSGPEPEDFPRVVSSAPVTWDYFGTKLYLHFHAGIFGAKLDEKTQALQSVSGWVVSHDPPKEPKQRIVILEKELVELKKCGSSDYDPQWVIHSIEKELEQLKKHQTS